MHMRDMCVCVICVYEESDVCASKQVYACVRVVVRVVFVYILFVVLFV